MARNFHSLRHLVFFVKSDARLQHRTRNMEHETWGNFDCMEGRKPCLIF